MNLLSTLSSERQRSETKRSETKRSETMWSGLRRYAAQAQRGATLTGYSLIVATFVTFSLAVIQTLESNSEDFLTDTGSEIGTPRLPRDQVATSLLPPAPAYAAPTLPPGILTFDDEYVMIGALGSCLDLAAGNILSFDPTLPCGTNGTNIQLTAHSNNAAELTLSLGGQCLTASGANVIAIPCSTGATNQEWWQIDGVAPNTVIYRLANSPAPGQCIGLAPTLIPGDPAFVMVPCDGVELEILL